MPGLPDRPALQELDSDFRAGIKGLIPIPEIQ
jgi:hypothetical protein